MSRVVIAAGGTGGHFFPAEALAGQLASRGHELVLMTDRRGGLRGHGVFAGAPQHVIAGAGIAGRGAVAKLRGLATMARGVVQARRLLATLEADAVVGFGGYPSVAPLLAARLMARGRPAILLHEGNAVLGQANAQLARIADGVATSFEATARLAPGRGTLTGMPVRDEIAVRAASPYPDAGGTLNLLVWGGSLGARIFSDIVPAALASLAGRVRVVQQARAEDVDRVRAAYEAAGIEAEVAPFLDRVAERLAAAHLVIGRAGGSSVAELSCIGRPSILVPLPIAASDEQTANARALVAAGAAWLLPQPDFTKAALSALLADLFAAPERLAMASTAAAALGRPDAACRLADLVERTLRAPSEWRPGASGLQRSPKAFFTPAKDTEQPP